MVFYIVTPCSLVDRYSFEEHGVYIFRGELWHEELAQLFKQIARKVVVEGEREM
jgi:hypothetical protein